MAYFFILLSYIFYKLLMHFLKNLLYLFYPNFCICGKILLRHESILCSVCRHDLPLIDLKNHMKNEINTIFSGRIPIKKITSFLYFKKGNSTQKLIHQLKYKGNQKIGSFLGNWFGKQLEEQKIFSDVDYIIPVPLHLKKEKERGYNQVASFGKRLSKTLNIKYLDTILKRVSSTKTQTFKKRFERFSNLNTKFHLTDTKTLENKHILLIDDVITTGATLEACCNELLKTKNIIISIATMAYTEQN